MKKLLLFIVSILLLQSCATTRLTTDIGIMIGNSYQKSAQKGTISAEQSIKAWPYISGQIKGLLASNYALDIAPMATEIIDELDKLALKDNLTNEEKGYVIGYFVRLETVAIEQGWDKYGVSIMKMLTGFLK